MKGLLPGRVQARTPGSREPEALAVLGGQLQLYVVPFTEPVPKSASHSKKKPLVGWLIVTCAVKNTTSVYEARQFLFGHPAAAAVMVGAVVVSPI